MRYKAYTYKYRFIIIIYIKVFPLELVDMHHKKTIDIKEEESTKVNNNSIDHNHKDKMIMNSPISREMSHHRNIDNEKIPNSNSLPSFSSLLKNLRNSNEIYTKRDNNDKRNDQQPILASSNLPIKTEFRNSNFQYQSNSPIAIHPKSQYQLPQLQLPLPRTSPSQIQPQNTNDNSQSYIRVLNHETSPVNIRPAPLVSNSVTSSYTYLIDDNEIITNKYIDPYNLSKLQPDYISTAPGSVNDITTRCWFHYCLRNFELNTGDYFNSIQEAKYGMWLYFTAKQGIFLRQTRSRGIRDQKQEEILLNNYNNNKYIDIGNDNYMTEQKHQQYSISISRDQSQSASFSYSCKNCKKPMFVAKKKVSRSYNDGVNNNAPIGVWVIRTIAFHPHNECMELTNFNTSSPLAATTSSLHGPQSPHGISSPQSVSSEWNNTTSLSDVKLNCPHTLDLIKTIKNRVSSRSGDIVKEAVYILQDIHFGKVYDETRGILSSLNKSNLNNNMNIFIEIDSNQSRAEISYIKKRQELMTRMVKRRVRVVR